MPENLVSVITPTFNRPPSLKQAIKSVLAQNYPHFEQLIINDGGEDVSSVVSSFSDPRLRYFKRPHEGKAAVLNFAFTKAQGQYVTYLDDDDIIYPEHLMLLVEALKANQDAEAAYSDTFVVYQRLLGGCWSEVYRQVENNLDVDYSMLYWQNYINHKNIMHTRKFAAEIGGYDESLPVLIDWDFIRRLAQQTRLVHVRKVTAEYFRRVGDANSKTAIYFEKPQVFSASEKRIMEKLPPHGGPRRKNPPMKAAAKPITEPPALKENSRLLLFRSAPMEVFKKALTKVKDFYPKAVIDVLGQPPVINELESLPNVNQVLLYQIGHFDPAHLSRELLEVLVGNDYHLGVIVFADREGCGYKNVVSLAKVLTFPLTVAINPDLNLFTL